MGSYNTSDFKRGLKVQIDGDPYLMVECNFVKPGKGNALYTLFYYIGGVTGITAGGYLYTHAGWMMVVALCAAMLVLPLGAGIAEAARSRSASA